MFFYFNPLEVRSSLFGVFSLAINYEFTNPDVYTKQNRFWNFLLHLIPNPSPKEKGKQGFPKPILFGTIVRDSDFFDFSE